MSEGVRRADGKFLSESGLRDAFGHAQLGGVAPVIAQLVQERLKQKYHWAVADYLQRAARHIASQTDVEQAYRLGEAAVKLALQGHNAVMLAAFAPAGDPQWFTLLPRVRFAHPGLISCRPCRSSIWISPPT